MIKTMFAVAVLAFAAAPLAAQTALPRCSATVHDSCDQGADNPAAMTADQAMASGGVGDRGHDNAAHMGGAKPMAKKKVHHTMTKKAAAGTTTTTDTTTTTTKP